jgi:hypothetical protein
MATPPALYLGSTRALDGAGVASHLHLPAHHLVTHGVVVGMTGSGKTGLTTVMIEEAMSIGVPVLVIDVKGDLPNLLLAFPDFDIGRILPWVEGCASADETRSSEEVARVLSEQRRLGLEGWRIGAPELAHFASKTEVRVITPGSSAPANRRRPSPRDGRPRREHRRRSRRHHRARTHGAATRPPLVRDSRRAHRSWHCALTAALGNVALTRTDDTRRLQRARMEHAKVIGRPFEPANTCAGSLATGKSVFIERPVNPLAVLN